MKTTCRRSHEYAVPPSPGHVDPVPSRAEDFPLRVVAPAYLLSELTTALLMGFYVYLPFLVIDLVVSSVLAATGLFMLPPALVATPDQADRVCPGRRLAPDRDHAAVELRRRRRRRAVIATKPEQRNHPVPKGRPSRGCNPCDRLVARGAR